MKKTEFPHASDDFKKRNPHLFVGRLEQPQRKQNVGSQSPNRPVAARPGCLAYRVRLTSFRRKLLDGDNLQTGLKPLRDAIAATLGIDDADCYIQWEYHQVATDGPRGVNVLIHPQGLAQPLP